MAGHKLSVYGIRQIEFYKSAILKYCFWEFRFSREKSLKLTIGRFNSHVPEAASNAKFNGSKISSLQDFPISLISIFFVSFLRFWRTELFSILSLKISNILSANEKRALRKKLLIAQKLANQYRDEIKQNSHGRERTKVSCKSVATRTNLSDLQTRPHRTDRQYFRTLDQDKTMISKMRYSDRIGRPNGTEPWIHGRILMI